MKSTGENEICHSREIAFTEGTPALVLFYLGVLEHDCLRSRKLLWPDPNRVSVRHQTSSILRPFSKHPHGSIDSLRNISSGLELALLWDINKNQGPLYKNPFDFQRLLRESKYEQCVSAVAWPSFDRQISSIFIYLCKLTTFVTLVFIYLCKLTTFVTLVWFMVK